MHEANHRDLTELGQKKVCKTRQDPEAPRHICSEETIHHFKESLKFLEFGSTVLAENGFARILGLAGSALIPVRSHSGNSKRLAHS
jgi:hypothetical protein